MTVRYGLLISTFCFLFAGGLQASDEKLRGMDLILKNDLEKIGYKNCCESLQKYEEGVKKLYEKGCFILEHFFKKRTLSFYEKTLSLTSREELKKELDGILILVKENHFCLLPHVSHGKEHDQVSHSVFVEFLNGLLFGEKLSKDYLWKHPLPSPAWEWREESQLKASPSFDLSYFTHKLILGKRKPKKNKDACTIL